MHDGGNIFFGRRQNTSFEDGAYHVSSGHLEAGESLPATLIRETKEKIGVTITPEAIEFAHVMHNSSSGGRVAYFFTVHHREGTPENREPDKCSELRRFPLNALRERMIAYCHIALDHATASQPFPVYGL